MPVIPEIIVKIIDSQPDVIVRVLDSEPAILTATNILPLIYTGSLGGSISSSYASTASYSDRAGLSQASISSSYSQTSSLSVTSSYSFTTLSSSFAKNADVAKSASYSQISDTSLTATSSQTAISSSYSNFATNASTAISSSWAPFQVTSSYSISSSFASNANTAITASYIASASHADKSDTSISSSYSTTSSYALNVPATSSYAISSSFAQNTINANDSLRSISSSYSITASYALNVPLTSSYALTSSFVATASTSVFSNTSISASHSNISDTAITASYGISSSFATNALTSNLSTSSSFAGTSLNSNTSTSASYAVSSSNSIISSTSINSSFATAALSSSYSTTSSFANNSLTSNLATTASYVATASYAANVPATSSYAITASFAQTASFALNVPVTSSYSISSSYALTASSALTASYLNPLTQTLTITGSTLHSGSVNVLGYAVSASFFSGSGIQITGIVSSSYATTASYALNGGGGSVSASYALTSSYANQANSASYATTASYANDLTKLPLAGGTMTGQLNVRSIVSIKRDTDAAELIRIDNTGTGAINLYDLYIIGASAHYGPNVWYGSGQGVRWSSTATSDGTVDVGLYRNAAGILEINNGTAGTYRDLTLRTLTSTAGTITANTPAFTATQTWNNVATTFNGIFLNVTNTTSATASRLMDLQVGGATRMSLSPVTGLLLTSNTPGSTNNFLFSAAGVTIRDDGFLFLVSGKGFAQSDYSIGLDNGKLRVSTTGAVAFTSGNQSYHTIDAQFQRNAAGVLEINNGTTGIYRDLKLRDAQVSGSVYVTGSVSASFFSGSGANITGVVTSSYATTASYALTSAGTVTNASTASYVNTLNQNVILTGSLFVSGNINNSGYSITASLFNGTGIVLGTNPAATGVIRLSNNSTISARNAANNADFPLVTLDTSNRAILGSVGVNSSLSGIWNVDTGTGTLSTYNSFPIIWANDTAINRSAAGTVEITNGTVGIFRDLILRNLISSGTISGSHIGDGSGLTGLISSSYAVTASYVSGQSVTSSYALTASYVASASHANNSDTAISASYVTTASYALTSAGTVTNAVTASYVNPLNQTVLITGSLTVSGSIDNTGYFVSASAFSGSGVGITGIISSSYALSGSYAASASYASDSTKLPLAGGTMTGTITSTLGTITANTPMISGSQTWNNGAATFYGIDLDIGHVAYAAASRPLRLRYAGVDIFNVTAGGIGTFSQQVVSRYLSSNESPFGWVLGTLFGGLALGSGHGVRWASTTSADTTNDVGIFRNAAGVLEVNKGKTGTYRDLTLRSLISTTGTITSSAPAFSATQTWSGSANTFQGIFLNVTNTASAGASTLINLQIGGTSYFKVDRNGDTTNFGGIQASRFLPAGGNIEYGLHPLLGSLRIIKWASTDLYNGTIDTGLTRNTAGVLEINNGTSGIFRDLTLRNLIASGTISGSHIGDGSGLTGVISSSYALTASYVSGQSVTSSYALTASYVASSSHANNSDTAISASYVLTASYALTSAGTVTNATTASYVNPLNQLVQITGSLKVSGSIDNTGYAISASVFSGSGAQIVGIISSSYSTSSSYTLSAASSNTTVSASYATTASYANDPTKLPLTGGTMSGTITSTFGTLTTTDKPFFNGTATWNDGQVAFTGIKLNITNTTSGAQSRLLDLQLGGTSAFFVSSTGTTNARGIVSSNIAGGELRSYQVEDGIYVSLKTNTGTNKSGLFRSNTDFFVYYDTSTGDTNLDATFAGSNILFKVLGNEKMRVQNNGVLSFGTVDNGIYRNAAGVLEINNGTTGSFRDLRLRDIQASGSVYVTGSVSASSLTIVGPSIMSGSLDVSGSFKAITKSFLIKHPTQLGKQLEHGVVEGPEHTVFFRGRLTKSNLIELPEYWTKLIRPETITVQLTPIGKSQSLFVQETAPTHIVIGVQDLLIESIDCYYYVQAERADVDRLITEIG